VHNESCLLFYHVFTFFPSTQVALAQKLTTMQLQEWIALIKLVTVDSFPAVLQAITESYQERIMQSPIWRLHKIIEVWLCPMHEFSACPG